MGACTVKMTDGRKEERKVGKKEEGGEEREGG